MITFGKKIKFHTSRRFFCYCKSSPEQKTKLKQLVSFKYFKTNYFFSY